VALTAQQALSPELMQFYIREAWLLDERKLNEWLDLLTDDVLYFMPRRKNVPRWDLYRELTPLGDLAIPEEGKRYLEMRVVRFDAGMTWPRISVAHRSPDRQSRGDAAEKQRV
jgi:3-phenylpropionate/cinnamic acid dioxygenase small subunit